MLESIVNCFEFIIDPKYTFHFTKENIISYFYAFTICKLNQKRNEVLEKLLKDLIDDNIIYFIKVISSLEDQFLFSYSYWLCTHILLKITGQNEELKFKDYKYDEVVKISKEGKFYFDEQHLCFQDNKKNIVLKTNICFLKNYYTKHISESFNKYYAVNNYFNVGKIHRRKSEVNLTDDYPHYYQINLENDKDLILYAKRKSENSSFTISKVEVII